MGVAEQNDESDVPCLFTKVPCTQDPSQTLCRYGPNIRVLKQHAKDATGPVTARYLAERLYNNEDFVLQTDAHMEFVPDWDVDIVQQFYASGNE